MKLKDSQSITEKFLFHGTSKTKPKQIYESDEGFDMRFSNGGTWGQAVYFAVNASYSHKFRYENIKKNTYKMFYARVMTG